MKVICVGGNLNCENYVHEKEFDIDEEDFDNARCPECGGKVAPAWLKEYMLPGEEELRLPGEEELRTELKELYDKRDSLERRRKEIL